jgi:flagellar motor switch/type III secretory pathway protein FliN
LVVEGVLGRAEIAMQEFRELAVGDVLVLDRALREPVEVRTTQNRRRIGHGKLSQREGRTAVQF